MKKIALLLNLTLWAAVGFSQSDAPCHLVVKVENIKKIQGHMMFAVYDHDEKFLKEAISWGDSKISENWVIYTFEGLKAGIYAISIFHDENDNGKLDTNFIGIPTEPYGFSNNAKGMFGPPDFKDCQVEVAAGKKEIVITL